MDFYSMQDIEHSKKGTLMISLLANIHINPISVMIALLALSAAIVVVFFLFYRRHRRQTRESIALRDLAQKAIDLCGLSVLRYNVKTDLFTSNAHLIIPMEGMNMFEFKEHIHPQEYDAFKRNIDLLFSGKEHVVHQKVRWNVGTSERPFWFYFEGHIISDADKGGEINTLYFIGSDVTKVVNETKQNEANLQRYKKIFQTSLTAMSFYMPDGVLLDYNDKMRELCNITPETETYFRNTKLFDLPLIKKDFDPTSHDEFYACQKMVIPESGVMIYIEFLITPLFDDEGNHVYYIVTCRDVTPDRNVYMEQHQHEIELQEWQRQINEYEEQLHYLLKNNQMFVWWTDPANKIIHFSQSLKNVDYSRDFDTYVNSLADPEHREQAKLFLDNYEKMDRDVQMTHHFLNTPVDKDPQWYIISGMPIHDENGTFTGHFGVLRNITYLMDTQERLRRETARANDSGRMKSLFLANMTHEIRTPLNAIVGFSDLLQTIDAPEDRQEFIRIIRNNCDMLLRLINDILEASNMDKGVQSISLEDVDFAYVFNDICQTLAQRVQNPAVKFLCENPYTSLQVRIDKGRVQQIITNFVTNAVKYTEQGHIKVGYQYENSQLYIYCEDTGAGIPKEKQNMVFERFVKLNDFVQGTGLGLSICKSIAERCGGRIGVLSDGEGKGSTFWVRIPCE